MTAKVHERHAPSIAWPALAVVLIATAINLLADALRGGEALFLYDWKQHFDDYFKFILSFPPHGPVAPAMWAQDRVDVAIHHNPLVGVEGLPGRALTNLFVPPLTASYCIISAALMRIVDPSLLFGATLAALAGYWIALVVRYGERQARLAWVALGLLCYPALMAAERGNVYAVATALLVIHALLLSLRGRAPLLAAILLAVAVNIRPNAVLFLWPVLALQPRPWRTLAVFGGVGTAMFGLSLAFAHMLYPEYTLATFRAGLGNYHLYFVVNDAGLSYGSSLFGALKLLFNYSAAIEALPVACALAILGTGAILHWRQPLRSTVMMFLTLAAYTLGSTVITDYHLLVFLIVPLALAAEARPLAPASLLAGMASVAMLAPKNVATLGPVSWQVMLNPLLLLVTAGMVIAIEWGERRRSAAPHRPLATA